jgi:hypothetical protein
MVRERDHYETLAVCRTLGLARAAFAEWRLVHDPATHPRREAPPGWRLVRLKYRKCGNFSGRGRPTPPIANRRDCFPHPSCDDPQSG